MVGNVTEKLEEIKSKLNDTMSNTCDEMIGGLEGKIISTLKKMKKEISTAFTKETITEGQF